MSSIEDLFETQRRELFSRLSEQDKNVQNKFAVVERAVVDLAHKTPEVAPATILIQV